MKPKSSQGSFLAQAKTQRIYFPEYMKKENIDLCCLYPFDKCLYISCAFDSNQTFNALVIKIRNLNFSTKAIAKEMDCQNLVPII